MPKLGVVICSTRPNRIGLSVSEWFETKAKQHGKFEVERVDLKEIALPALDEATHPMKKQYEHEHTKAWSRLVASLDAFTFVTPEYNYFMPPALVNAFDYLHSEWSYKAASFVSYGGMSGGLRAVQAAKPLLTSFKVMPIPEGVAFPFAAKLLSAAGKFDPGNTQDEAVTRMLDELARWTGALAPLRAH
jgi:NAD(P)H-dependent FMN reductase